MHTYKSARTRRTDTHTHFAYDHSTDTDRRQRHSAPMVQTLVLCYIPPFHSTSSLAYAALVVVELQRGLDVVGERPQLLLAEQVLEQREDPLARGRVRRDGEDDACCERPRRKGSAVAAPPIEDRVRDHASLSDSAVPPYPEGCFGGPTAIDLTNPRRSRVPRRAARRARHRQARRRTSRSPRAPPRRPLWLAAANLKRPSPRTATRALQPRRRVTTRISASSLSTRKMARRQSLEQSQTRGPPRGSRRITRSGDRQMRPPDMRKAR